MDSRFLSGPLSVMRCEAPVLVRVGNMPHPLLAELPPGRYACGVCVVCCWRWSRQVVARAVREFEASPPGHVAVKVDLTFSDDVIGQAWPDFGRSEFERFRRSFGKAYGRALPDALPVKWLGTPELGELRGRLHIHAVAYCVRRSFAEGPTVLEGSRAVVASPMLELVRRLWPSFVRVEVVESAGGVRYVCKYALKNREAVAAQLKAHRAAARRARETGAPVPTFERAWWLCFPRGRGGGLGASYAEAIGRANAGSAEARAFGDVAPIGRPGAGGVRPVRLSRYEARKARQVAGLDDPVSKRRRAMRNPESVEMASRLAAHGGSFDQLRIAGGHRDDAASAAHVAWIRTQKSLGRG